MKVKRAAMKYENRLFPWYMHKSINELRQAGFCCDVVLTMNDKEFRAHKTILSAASPFFCAMFNSEFKEARTNTVDLKDVDSDSVSAILDFIYSSQLTLNMSNVFPLMDASNYLQVSATRLLINNYLHHNVTLENCVGIYERASNLRYFELAHKALVFIRKNFIRVVEEKEFVQASKELLATLLDSNFLNVQNENFLIKVIMKWINANPTQRKRHTAELLNKLELRNIDLRKLTNLRKDNIFNEDDELSEFLVSKIEEWAVTPPVERSARWKTLRHAEEQVVIFAVGGEIDEIPTRSMECFTFGYDSWRRTVPQYIYASKGPKNVVTIAGMNIARTNAAVANDDYNIYVIGGRGAVSCLSDCEYYNIRANAWTNMTPLPVKLEGGSAVFFEGRLIVMGGRNDEGCSKEVWQWERTKGTWKRLSPLVHARAFHCSISFGGYIYTMGGLGSDNRTALRSVERYDPYQKIWHDVQSMHKPRGKFASTVLNNYIYVMGGTDRGSTLRSVERYCLEANTWSYMTPMPSPRASHAVVIYEKKILCISGTNNINNLRSIDKFSPSSNRWHYLFSTQSPRCGLGAALLYVPFIAEEM